MMWILLIVGIAFAGLFAHDRIQTGRLDSAKAETKAVQANLTVATSANADLQATVQRQNAGLESLKAEADKRLAAATAARAQAAQANAKLKEREQQLANEQPQFPGDACRSACAALRQPL